MNTTKVLTRDGFEDVELRDTFGTLGITADVNSTPKQRNKWHISHLPSGMMFAHGSATLKRCRAFLTELAKLDRVTDRLDQIPSGQDSASHTAWAKNNMDIMALRTKFIFSQL